MHAKSLQSCLILCNSMDSIPPGSSIHGINQARILEWVVMPSSRGSSWPRDRTCIGRQVLYQECHLGSLFLILWLNNSYNMKLWLQNIYWAGSFNNLISISPYFSYFLSLNLLHQLTWWNKNIRKSFASGYCLASISH